jgi:hypothetical protein
VLVVVLIPPAMMEFMVLLDPHGDPYTELQEAAAANSHNVYRRTGQGSSLLHLTQLDFEPRPRLYRHDDEFRAALRDPSSTYVHAVSGPSPERLRDMFQRHAEAAQRMGEAAERLEDWQQAQWQMGMAATGQAELETRRQARQKLTESIRQRPGQSATVPPPAPSTPTPRKPPAKRLRTTPTITAQLYGGRTRETRVIDAER